MTIKEELLQLLEKLEDIIYRMEMLELPINNARSVKAKNAIPPTVEEVAAYCMERQNSVNALAFCDFYESKGWVVGKTKMKSWQAAVRTWEKRDGRGPAEKPTAPAQVALTKEQILEARKNTLRSIKVQDQAMSRYLREKAERDFS